MNRNKTVGNQDPIHTLWGTMFRSTMRPETITPRWRTVQKGSRRGDFSLTIWGIIYLQKPGSVVFKWGTDNWKGGGNQGTRPRHVDFNRLWEENKALAWLLAIKVAKAYKDRYKASDIIGTMVIRMNLAAHTYQRSKGAFTSYFYSRYFQYVWFWFLRHESEYLSVYHFNHKDKKDPTDVKVQQLEYNYHEQDFYLYRIPDKDESWTDEILGAFNTSFDCWKFLTANIKGRDLSMLEMRFKHGMTYGQIADRQKPKITKERVRQLIEVSLRRIKDRISHIEKFLHLFKSEKSNDET